MNHKDKTLLGSAIGAILCVAATSASAVTLSASNVCGTPPCGASFLSGQWNQSPSAVVEEQYFMVDVGASDLLTYTGEHLAMSAFAQSQPFNSSNSWVQPPAPNGGIGVALGTISNSSWPTCQADSGDQYVEFAIERFGYNGTTGTRILDCARVSKSTLYQVYTLRVEVYVTCSFGTCSASASLSNPVTSQVYASLTRGGIALQNPTGERDIWYGFLNVSSSTLDVEYTVVSESYSSAP
jgi:hypothetical protein